MPKAPAFGPGSIVFVKKEKCPGIILAATGKGKFDVETLNEDTGRPTGIKVHLTSQQMRNIKPHDFPFQQDEEERKNNEEPSGNSGVQEARTDAEDAAVTTVETVLDDANEGEVHIEVNPTGNAANQRTGNVTRSQQPAFAEEKKDDCLGAPDANPDEAETEDFLYFPLDDDDQDTLNPNDALAAHGIERDEEKHKNKWNKYKMERAALIEGGWEVECLPPKQDGLGVGARVQECSGQKCFGTIFFDDRLEFKLAGEPKWGVVFDGETYQTIERKLPSSKLKRVKDERVFVWKAVEDSIPERPPAPFANSGVAGFDFATKFAPDKISLAEGDPLYDFPFLSLLEHLWPGRWRSHLRNLNSHIERVNSQNAGRHGTKKNKKLVSGKMLTVIFAILSLLTNIFIHS